jgi:hypothetical protein
VKSAVSLGAGALELSTVERRLLFSGSLPVVDELPQLFVNTTDVFTTTTSEPTHASPYY